MSCCATRLLWLVLKYCHSYNGFYDSTVDYHFDISIYLIHFLRWTKIVFSQNVAICRGKTPLVHANALDERQREENKHILRKWNDFKTDTHTRLRNVIGFGGAVVCCRVIVYRKIFSSLFFAVDCVSERTQWNRWDRWRQREREREMKREKRYCMFYMCVKIFIDECVLISFTQVNTIIFKSVCNSFTVGVA